MENEIKVGEYCRTRKGIIGILKQQFIFGHGVNYPEPQEWVIDVKGKEYVTTECDVDFDNIVKHSPNLIDLIQCGDYVNGKQVSNVDKVDNTNFIEWTDGDMYKTEIKNDKFIETIVTKEQFESISYKVTKM